MRMITTFKISSGGGVKGEALMTYGRVTSEKIKSSFDAIVRIPTEREVNTHDK